MANVPAGMAGSGGVRLRLPAGRRSGHRQYGEDSEPAVFGSPLDTLNVPGAPMSLFKKLPSAIRQPLEALDKWSRTRTEILPGPNGERMEVTIRKGRDGEDRIKKIERLPPR